MKITHTFDKSSFLKEVSWDGDLGLLMVKMKKSSKKIYCYSPVCLDEILELCEAKEPGKVFNQIKNADDINTFTISSKGSWNKCVVS